MPATPETPETPDIPALEQRRDSILAALTTLGDMRPGSLVHRFMKCSKPTCRCHDKDHPGHGPYYVLVRHVNGQRTSRSLPQASATAVQAQVDAFQRFRSLSAELVAVSEQLADARLGLAADARPAAVKKKPARSSSAPPSKPNSPAS